MAISYRTSIALMMLITSTVVFAGKIVVDVSGTGDYSTIQLAIDASEDGDTVTVMPGVYVENIDMLGKAITLRSSDPNDYDIVLDTVIDGNASGSVITCSSSENSETVINGFFITNGSGNASNENGGGMYNSSASPTVINCVFSGNSVTDRGGAMANRSTSNPTISNCKFLANSAESAGAMYNFSSSSPTITNCVFSANSAVDIGGAIYNRTSSSPLITNCTFSGNTSGNGGAIGSNASNPVIYNSILWGNSASLGDDEIYNRSGATPTISYCDIAEWNTDMGTDDGGNIDADPLFEDDQLQLSGQSPCIDAGNNNHYQLDVADLDGNGVTDEAVPFDVDNTDRYCDDPNVIDIGYTPVPTWPVIDMGAYEYGETIEGDINADGKVDLADMSRLAANWLFGVKIENE